MDKFLAGKTAVVTGATRGIGRAVAETLLDAGASVAICARNAANVDEAVRQLRSRGNAIGIAADVGDQPQVSRLFQFVDENFGALDILINNAGVGAFAKVADMTVDQWRAVIDTNLSGVFYCSRAALSRFQRSGGGYIINISSLAGKNPFTRRRCVQCVEIRSERI